MPKVILMSNLILNVIYNKAQYKRHAQTKRKVFKKFLIFPIKFHFLRLHILLIYSIINGNYDEGVCLFGSLS